MFDVNYNINFHIALPSNQIDFTNSLFFNKEINPVFQKIEKWSGDFILQRDFT